MQRRSFGSLICKNALASDSPSDVAANLEIATIECPSVFRFDPFAEIDSSWKKKETGTPRKLAICSIRLALTLWAPFSYF